jgi:hypothetical protein
MYHFNTLMQMPGELRQQEFVFIFGIKGCKIMFLHPPCRKKIDMGRSFFLFGHR